MGDYPFGPVPQLALQAATPLAGVPLIDGTQNILSWTTPDDGRQHRAQLYISTHVTEAETGGGMAFEGTLPDGQGFAWSASSGGQAPGFDSSVFVFPVIVGPGATVTLTQFAALTAGAAVVWGEIWGS
jgi:predicted RecA/RadA family phage recombinase